MQAASGSYTIVIDLILDDPEPWIVAAVNHDDIFTPERAKGASLPRPDHHRFRKGQFEPAKSLPLEYVNLHTSKDWRAGPIHVFPLDMTEDPSGPMGQLKSRYLGHGVIKLYRDTEGDDHAEDQSEDHSEDQPEDQPEYQSDEDSEDGTVVSILAIPSYFTPSDIMGFVGQAAQKSVSHFRMLRSSVDNRYMLLMKFRTHESAKTFVKEYNGKLFNSMEPESCHVVFVRSIHFNTHVKSSDDNIPYLLEDPFTSGPEASRSLQKVRSNSTSAAHAMDRPVPPPPPSLRELPTCPVCLERMDTAVTGLLTILCQHTFHCQCLSKWGDGSCPVCRYSQRDRARAPGDPQAHCHVCNSTENLWSCLVCGHTGCGRYDLAHAFDHYVATGHCYAMNIDTQRVWDYANDGYVHRLLQNQADGKLVELPGPSPGGPGGSNGSYGAMDGGSSSTSAEASASDPKKIEELSMQYTALLTSQLESQRTYYEDMFSSAAGRAKEASERAENAEAQLQELTKQVQKLQMAHDSELPPMRRELQQARDKNSSLTQMYQKLLKSYNDEKVLARQMVERLDQAKKEAQEKDQQVKDLQEQLRDLMFYLDAQSKLASNEEAREGQVVMKPKKHGKSKK